MSSELTSGDSAARMSAQDRGGLNKMTRDYTAERFVITDEMRRGIVLFGIPASCVICGDDDDLHDWIDKDIVTGKIVDCDRS